MTFDTPCIFNKMMILLKKILQKVEEENSSLKDRILEMEADLATKSKILSESEINHKTAQAKLEQDITEQAGRLKEIEEAFTQLKDNPQVSG